MIIKNAKFITSVAESSKILALDKPIIAISGKSNVGKSSVINMLAGQKKLARTSVTPGRTRLINYFDFGEFVLCDLPGYGFAKAPKGEKQKWGKLMQDFLLSGKLDLIIQLVDIRHDPTEDDMMMVNFLYHYRLPFIIVATKADKVAKTKIKPRLMDIASKLKVGISDVTATSAEKNIGKTELLDLIEKFIKGTNENV